MSDESSRVPDYERLMKDDAPKPRTVRVRVAVAVDGYAQWFAAGSSFESEEEAIGVATGELESKSQVYFLTAELPIPEVPEVAASVERVESEVGK